MHPIGLHCWSPRADQPMTQQGEVLQLGQHIENSSIDFPVCTKKIPLCLNLQIFSDNQ